MNEQERHDQMHPGMMCRTCPDTLAHIAEIQSRVDRMRLPWWRRLFR